MLGLPSPRSRRTPFNQPQLRDKPLAQPLSACLPRAFADPATGEVVETLTIVKGYIDYVATRFVKPVFEERVLQADGGLIVTRSVASWLYGRQEPILKLALDEDDPRAALFSFLGPRDQDGLQDSEAGEHTACCWSKKGGLRAGPRVHEASEASTHTWLTLSISSVPINQR